MDDGAPDIIDPSLCSNAMKPDDWRYCMRPACSVKSNAIAASLVSSPTAALTRVTIVKWTVGEWGEVIMLYYKTDCMRVGA